MNHHHHHHYLARIIIWIAGTVIQIPLITAVASSSSSSRERITFNFGWSFRTGLADWAPPDEPAPTKVDPGQHPPEAEPEYDTSTWQSIQLPHDGLIANSPSKTACPDGCSGRSYLPRHVLWYRKTFSLPAAWYDDDGNKVIWLEFEGSFRNTTVWIDGQIVQSHDCGYTPFTVPLLMEEKEADHLYTIAIFVDPDNGDGGGVSKGSGWWYEGGGLYRSVWLNQANSKRRLEEIFVWTNEIEVKENNVSNNHPQTRSAMLHVNFTIVQDENIIRNSHLLEDWQEDDTICVDIFVSNQDGSPAASTVRGRHEFDPRLIASTQSYQSNVKLISPHLWTSSIPYLYHVTVTLTDCLSNNEYDSLSTHHGIRTIEYTADHGFFLNKQHFKIRGFCDHNTFGVVGMAVPDRIKLFRAQAARSIGSNGRRTSHNPPDPTMLDIYDRLGMVVLDENRLFRNKTEYVDNMASLVKRDRNHPSVILWSFCNEMDCEGKNQVIGPAFQEVVEKYDGTRPTLANMFSFNDLVSVEIHF